MDSLEAHVPLDESGRGRLFKRWLDYGLLSFTVPMNRELCQQVSY
jgi:hypothetical protein